MNRDKKSLLELSPEELHKLKKYTNALTRKAHHREASASDGTVNPIVVSAAHGVNSTLKSHDGISKAIKNELDGRSMDDLSIPEQIKLRADAHTKYLGNNKSPLTETHKQHKSFKPAAYGAHGATVYDKAGQLTQDDRADMNSFSDYGNSDLGDTNLGGVYSSEMNRGGDNFASTVANVGGSIDDGGNITGVTQGGSDVSKIKNNLSSEDAKKMQQEVQDKYRKHKDADTELYNTDHVEPYNAVLDDDKAKSLYSAVNNHYSSAFAGHESAIKSNLKNHQAEYAQAVQEGIASGINKFFPKHEHKDSNEKDVNRHMLNHIKKSASSIHNRLSTDPIAYRFGIKRYNAKQAESNAGKATSLSPEEIAQQYGDKATQAKPGANIPTQSAPVTPESNPSSAASAAKTLSPDEIKKLYGSQTTQPVAQKPKVDMSQHLDDKQHERFKQIKKT